MNPLFIALIAATLFFILGIYLGRGAKAYAKETEKLNDRLIEEQKSLIATLQASLAFMRKWNKELIEENQSVRFKLASYQKGGCK